MKSKAQSTVERARKLPAKRKAEAQAAWRCLSDAFETRQAAIPASRRPKSFEVHHTITKAREAFLGALVAGKSVAECAIAASTILDAAA